MKRDVCDRCLAVNVDNEDFSSLTVVFGNSHTESCTIKMSICEKCRPVIESIIKDRIILTTTPNDVKVGHMFYEPMTDSH